MSVNLIKRIGERTGLSEEKEILAYRKFCENADMEDGVIMFGNTKHEFYEKARKLISKNYNGDEIHKISSRYSQMAYNHFLNLFILKGLISEPHFVRMNRETKYPVLRGYNYFNDPEFYTPYRKKGEESWNGRISLSVLTPDMKKDFEDKGYEFKFCV